MPCVAMVACVRIVELRERCIRVLVPRIEHSLREGVEGPEVRVTGWGREGVVNHTDRIHVPAF